MEIMYAIISILFLSAVLLLMVMLFGKRKVSFFNFSKKHKLSALRYTGVMKLLFMKI